MMRRVILLCLLLPPVSALTGNFYNRDDFSEKVRMILYDQIISSAAWAMEQEPVTVTAFTSDRSQGDIHDFFSEGDYWWPDPENPEGPYIRRDGMSNPDNFNAHRQAMIRFSRVVGSLASAYLLTGEEKYPEHAFRHVRAWFIDPRTRMNPNLQYAQAIFGITPGRGIGIIDTIHLIEVAQGILRMQNADCMEEKELWLIQEWFAEYTRWLLTSTPGMEEMNAQNNHGTCWVMQAACFARLTGQSEVLELCRQRYREILLPGQMASDGSFPREIDRTKPYGYSLFNLDAMAAICQILSDEEVSLWEYHTHDNRGMKKAVEFMAPFIREKQAWPHPADVMYGDEWPVAHPSLLFASIAYGNSEWFQLWAGLEHHIAEGEVERNMPIRNPLIWL